MDVLVTTALASGTLATISAASGVLPHVSSSFSSRPQSGDGQATTRRTGVLGSSMRGVEGLGSSRGEDDRTDHAKRRDASTQRLTAPPAPTDGGCGCCATDPAKVIERSCSPRGSTTETTYYIHYTECASLPLHTRAL